MKVKEKSEKGGLKLNIQKTKIMACGPISSVQFSHSVVSDSLRPHELQHTRPPCPSPTPVILEPKKIKSVTVSIVSPSICHEGMEADAMILVF